MRKKIIIDKEDLSQKVQELKGKYSNIANLSKAISANYNGKYSFAVVQARIIEYGIDTGFNIEIKSKPKKDEMVRKSIHQMLSHTPAKFRKFVIQLRDNPSSRRLAIKLKCLECSNYQQAEIRNCQCIDCALYIFRPYK